MRCNVRHWMCALALYLRMRTRLTAQIVCELYFCPTAGKRVSPPLPPSPTPGTWGRGSVSTCTCSSRWPLASGCNIGRSAWWPWLHLRCQTWRPRAPVWSLTEAEKKTGKQKIILNKRVFFLTVCVRLYALLFWHFFPPSFSFFPERKDHSLKKARLNHKEMSRWSEGFFFFFLLFTYSSLCYWAKVNSSDYCSVPAVRRRDVSRTRGKNLDILFKLSLVKSPCCDYLIHLAVNYK